LDLHHGFLVVGVGPAKSLSASASLAFSASSGHRELLRADSTWVFSRIRRIGRLWGATLILGWVQGKPWLSLAAQQQVQTGYQVLELLF